jgi:hypothetical protein
MMAWILIVLIGSYPVTITYPTLQDCSSARDFAKRDSSSAFCIPAPEKR